jgi:hypothetical protein
MGNTLLAPYVPPDRHPRYPGCRAGERRALEKRQNQPLDSDKLGGSKKEEHGNTVSSMLLRGQLAIAVLGRHQFVRQLCARLPLGCNSSSGCP